MKKITVQKTVALTLLAAFALLTTFSISPATFATSPSNNGVCGAMNMSNSAAMMNFNSGPMSHDGTPGLDFFHLQGNLGMFTAVGNSACP
ncbi:MAG: hypothetical protein JRN21_06035 [Nitrososphaerota archaeon]|nr:hypothetical protein [Nitrososphaerota archaeon]